MKRLAIVCLFLFGVVPQLTAAEVIDFEQDIVPILERHCVACHGSDDPEGGIALDSFEGLLSGGRSGIAVTAGVAASSRLLLMASHELAPFMPPVEEDGSGERLSELELEILANWIDQGAVGPVGESQRTRMPRVPDIARADEARLPATAIASSVDGRLVAVGRYGLVEVRDDQQALVAQFEEGVAKVNSLEFSTDRQRLLVGTGVAGAYGAALLFDLGTGQLVREFSGHRDAVYAAAFSPDGLRVATAGYDRDVVLWDVERGEELRRMVGHNGAVYDLAFSPDGACLASACADETVKVWSVETGERLDTMSQPEGEVFAVDFTQDGKFVVAASADSRLRVWELRSSTAPAINPLVVTRFVDESPLVDFCFTAEQRELIVLSKGGKLKVVSTMDWTAVAELESLVDVASGLCVGPDGKQLAISMLDGSIEYRELRWQTRESSIELGRVEPVVLDLGELQSFEEVGLAFSEDSEHVRLVSRGCEVVGKLSVEGEVDTYQWSAHAGEVWAIDVDGLEGSSIDPVVRIVDEQGHVVIRTRLQAIRDSYFTFRGKNSSQSDDFRLFNWQEIKLGDYLYAAGEVTKMWMHPRGPDSGFNVYPGEGDRWTYFGTTPTTHALGEPAYVVRELLEGEQPLGNGLPVFEIPFENDDDPMRVGKTASRLLFTPRSSGAYRVQVRDTRGAGGADFGYKLRVRAASPSFTASVSKPNSQLRPGTGREFIVRVERQDGFMGAVTFDVEGLPAGVVANTPLTIEEGQRYAVGTIWAAPDAQAWDKPIEPRLTARASIHGRVVERRVGTLGTLTLGEPPRVVPSVQPIDRDVPFGGGWTLAVRRGETVTARVVLQRAEGFDEEVRFGNETAGRNASQGVYVDNIGLNGLLVLPGANEREFFLTADETAVPGDRSFFLTASVDDNVTSYPITVRVLP